MDRTGTPRREGPVSGNGGPGAGGLLQAAGRLVLGACLVVYALRKIAEPALFLKSIHEYAILPEHPPLFLNLAAVVVPWIELSGGGLLLLGVLRRGAAAVITLMLVVFTAAVWARALAVQAETGQAFCAIAFDCGCGTGEVVICEKLAYNALLIALGAWTALARSDRLTLPILMARRAG